MWDFLYALDYTRWIACNHYYNYLWLRIYIPFYEVRYPVEPGAKRRYFRPLRSLNRDFFSYHRFNFIKLKFFFYGKISFWILFGDEFDFGGRTPKSLCD